MFATKTIFALTALASLSVVGTANANEFQSNGRTSVVRYDDINLADAAGQKELQRRIRAASSRVCANIDLVMARACAVRAQDNVQAPMARAIARAASGERFADATDAHFVIGK